MLEVSFCQECSELDVGNNGEPESGKYRPSVCVAHSIICSIYDCSRVDINYTIFHRLIKLHGYINIIVCDSRSKFLRFA